MLAPHEGPFKGYGTIGTVTLGLIVASALELVSTVSVDFPLVDVLIIVMVQLERSKRIMTLFMLPLDFRFHSNLPIRYWLFGIQVLCCLQFPLLPDSRLHPELLCSLTNEFAVRLLV